MSIINLLLGVHSALILLLLLYGIAFLGSDRVQHLLQLRDDSGNPQPGSTLDGHEGQGWSLVIWLPKRHPDSLHLVRIAAIVATDHELSIRVETDGSDERSALLATECGRILAGVDYTIAETAHASAMSSPICAIVQGSVIQQTVDTSYSLNQAIERLSLPIKMLWLADKRSEAHSAETAVSR